MRFSSHQQVCEVSSGEHFSFTWIGIIDPSDVTALFDEVRRHSTGGRVRFLWNMSQTQLIPGETRRRLLDELVRIPLAATAIVTSSFYVRVPITMVLEVASTEIEERPPYRFFDAEEDAFAWLDSIGSKDD